MAAAEDTPTKPFPLNISERGLSLIKEFEQCRLDAYMPTPDDVPTIGYGHTGIDVQMGLRWTQEQADEALARDVMRFEAGVNEAVTVPLTQNEFDALVCFAFNVGTGAFRSSTLLRLLNAGDYDGAAAQLLRWNKQAGKELAGLTRRRAAERALFESDVA